MLHRLLHRGPDPVAIRVAQLSGDRVLFGAQADSRDLAEWGIERMRAAIGIDQDLRPFYERFRFDPLIGPAVRSHPGLRAAGRPDPFEALVWAVCEQLIEYERAAAIQRRLVARLGRRCSGHRPGRLALGGGARGAGAGPAGVLRSHRDPGAARSSGWRARSPRAGSTCLTPITSAAGGACAGSAASPGRGLFTRLVIRRASWRSARAGEKGIEGRGALTAGAALRRRRMHR